MADKVYVRREGAVCTVFTDESGNPQPYLRYGDPAPGFPYTTNEAALRQRYPGREIVFIEEERPPQPVLIHTPELEQKVADMLREAREPSPTRAAAVPAPTAPIPPRGPTQPLLQMQQLIADVLDAFEAQVRDALRSDDAEAKRDMEGVAAFFSSLSDEFATLVEAAIARAKQAPTKSKRRIAL